MRFRLLFFSLFSCIYLHAAAPVEEHKGHRVESPRAAAALPIAIEEPAANLIILVAGWSTNTEGTLQQMSVNSLSTVGDLKQLCHKTTSGRDLTPEEVIVMPGFGINDLKISQPLADAVELRTLKSPAEKFVMISIQLKKRNS